MAPKSKFKNPVNEIAAKFSSKFQVQILKNIGGVSILVTETEQKSQTEILRDEVPPAADFVKFLRFFGHKTPIFRDM